jgi:hypothetical protein
MDEHIKIFVGLDGRRLAPRGDRAPELALSGVRAGTDRRDRLRLAERSRAGELRAVGISGPADEAIRDVARARACGQRPDASTASAQGLAAAPRRALCGQAGWGASYDRGLAIVELWAAGAQTAFTEAWTAVSALMSAWRVPPPRLDGQIRRRIDDKVVTNSRIRA